MEFLSIDDLLMLIDELQIGPIRDFGLLESAIARPKTTLWGTEAYSTPFLKAAALLESLVQNHALVDGNKRLGWLATVVFLDINAIWIDAPDDAAFELVMNVAKAECSLDGIAALLKEWS